MATNINHTVLYGSVHFEYLITDALYMHIVVINIEVCRTVHIHTV
jgi:hypothetical protein